MSPLDVACITCRAERGQPCTTRRGTVVDYFHTVRESK